MSKQNCVQNMLCIINNIMMMCFKHLFLSSSSKNVVAFAAPNVQGRFGRTTFVFFFLFSFLFTLSSSRGRALKLAREIASSFIIFFFFFQVVVVVVKRARISRGGSSSSTYVSPFDTATRSKSSSLLFHHPAVPVVLVQIVERVVEAPKSALRLRR